MGNEQTTMTNNKLRNGGYSSVRTHRRNSSASLSCINSDMVHDMIQQSKENNHNNNNIKRDKNKKRLNSTSSLYRNKNTMDSCGNICVGSYCYCDCDTYYVVVTDILENNSYKIVDLFEQRSRISYNIHNLKLIDDDSKLRIAQQQHKTYLLNTDRNS